MGLSSKTGKVFVYNEYQYVGLYAKIITIPSDGGKKIQLGVYASKTAADAGTGIITLVEKNLSDEEHATYFYPTKAALKATLDQFVAEDSDTVNLKGLAINAAYKAMLELGNIGQFKPAEWEESAT